MQYRVPKKVGAALTLAAVLSAAALSLLGLSSLGVGLSALNSAAALVLFTMTALVIKRYVVFDCAYRLSSEYGEFSLEFFLLGKDKSRPAGKIEFCGKEALFPLDKKGKKAVRKLRRRSNMTSNLIPHVRYALTYEEEGEACYVIIEADSAFAAALQRQLDLAKTFYSAGKATNP